MTRTSLLVIAVLAAGCRSQAEGSPPPDELSEATREWMRSHFVEGRAIRDALVRGELDDARAGLRRMGRERGPSDVPADWAPRLTRLRASARDAAHATSLPRTARAFALVAVRCSECHAASDASIEFEELELPESNEAPAQMERHQWAAERMWEGLVAPSPERYREGATVLADSPLHPLELVVGSAPPAQVVYLGERVRTVAGEAKTAGTPRARAARYGELLATCASCHGQQ